MQVQITVFDDSGNPITRSSEDFDLLTEEEDPDSWIEAQDYLTENVLEPLQTQGFDIEEDEDDAVGVDLLAAWVIPEWFDSLTDALTALGIIVAECNSYLADLE